MKFNATVITFSVVGVLFGYLIGNYFGSSNKNELKSHQVLVNGRSPYNKTVFDLFVTLDFEDDKEKQTFKSLFQNYALWIKKHETTTISYELAESDKAPNRIIIIERYINKDAYLKIHRETDQFREFRSKLSGLKVTINGDSYIESNFGFI